MVVLLPSVPVVLQNIKMNPTLTTPQALLQAEIDRIIEMDPDPNGLRFESEILWRAADNMLATSGSFVRTLAELYLRADGFNQQKILKTWPNYFLQYAV